MADGYVQQQVAEIFGKGQLYCAETVVRLIAEAVGGDADIAVRMAAGFCSGASRTCGQCGAVSGAIMGIGLCAGRTEPGGEYEQAYAITQEFLEKFEKEFQSINCYELCGCDFNLATDSERFKAEGGLNKCMGMATFAVETVLSILREQGYLVAETDPVK